MKSREFPACRAGEDHPVKFAALLVDVPQHHGGPLPARSRVDVEGDEPVVGVPRLRPVDGLPRLAEVLLADERPGLGGGVLPAPGCVPLGPSGLMIGWMSPCAWA